MQQSSRSKWYVLPLITLGAVLIAVLLVQLPMFVSLELSSLNARFRLRGSSPLKHADVVCVGISQQAIDELPERWPWPREYFARLVRNLHRAGARVVGIDVLFDDPLVGDSLFAQALKEAGNVVLATNILAGKRTVQQVVKPSPCLVEVLDSGKNGMGFINTEADFDGFHRRYLPFAMVEQLTEHDVVDSQYNSFAVELVRQARAPHIAPGKVHEVDGVIHIDSLHIPLYDERSMMVNYYGPALSFPYYHFDLIIDDSTFTTNMEAEIDQHIDSYYELVKDSVFKDKIVIVGAVLAVLHDRFMTPFYDVQSINMPGMEIHANAVQMMLDGRFIRRVGIWWQLLAILLLGGLITLSTARLRSGWAMFVSLGLVVCYALMVYGAFIKFDSVLLLIMPLAAGLLVFAGNMLYQYVMQQQEKQRITGMFQHYVPRNVVEHLVNNPDAITLRGERRVLTALFTDIEGFTHISEECDPEVLVCLLREYLTVMTEVVIHNGGIIDKYEGDALVAEFGIPLVLPDHAYRACATALHMQEKLFVLNEQWRKKGNPQFRTRIGVSTGEMVFGNLGSEQVFDYTVLGDAVNLGARLESANKFYGTRILISDDTYKQASERILARELDMIRVVGKNHPVRVYNLIALADTSQSDIIRAFMSTFEQGLALYRNMAWDDALCKFEEVLALWGNDLATLTFIERCRAYQKNPPAPDWDGVWQLAGK